MKSAEYYKQLIRTVPRKKYFVSLAEIHRSAGAYDEAILVLKEGLKYHPEYIVGRVLLAQTYYEMGHFIQANHESHKIVDADPYNLLALKIFIRSSFKLGQQKKAASAIHQLRLLSPDDEEAMGWMTYKDHKKEVIDTLNRILIKLKNPGERPCQPF